MVLASVGLLVSGSHDSGEIVGLQFDIAIYKYAIYSIQYLYTIYSIRYTPKGYGR